jgi:hypothetical protein
MTKLEELWDGYEAARDTAYDNNHSDALDDALDAALDAYEAELKKTQEEKSDD